MKRKTYLLILWVGGAGSWSCGGETSGADSDGVSVGGASGAVGTVTGGVVASGGKAAGGAGNPSKPVECVPLVEEVEEATSCRLELSCDGNRVATTCTAGDEGRWNCLCASGSPEQSYEVAGVTGQKACEAAATLCKAGEPGTEPDACYEKELGLDAGFCEWQKTCAQSVEIDGATVTRNANTQVSCTWGDDTASCTCTGNNNAGRAYRISGLSGGIVCSLVIDLCTKDGPPIEPGTCWPWKERASGATCQAQRLCAPPRVSDSDVIDLEWTTAECYDPDTGTASCTCTSPGLQLNLAVSGEITDLTPCATVLEACARPEEIRVGEIQCRRAGLNAPIESYCQGYNNCTQAATVGDREFLITGQIAFECTPNDSGAGWFCNCFTNGDAANLDVSAASGWDVCAIAAEQCPALVQPMFLEPFERPLPGLPD